LRIDFHTIRIALRVVQRHRTKGTLKVDGESSRTEQEV